MKIILLSVWLSMSLLGAGMKEDVRGIWRRPQPEGKESGLQGLFADQITLEPLEPTEEHSADEVVRVRIVFDKEAVEEASIDALIDRISSEALDGEALDVRRKGIGENGISAYLEYGKIEAVRAVEGVKSVNLEKQYEMHESSGEEPGEEPDGGSGENPNGDPDEAMAGDNAESDNAEPDVIISEDTKPSESEMELSAVEDAGTEDIGRQEETIAQTDKTEEEKTTGSKNPGSSRISRTGAAGAGIIGALIVLAGWFYLRKQRERNKGH